MQLENRPLPTQAWAAGGRGHPRYGRDGEDSCVPDRINLRPLLSHQAAAEMLMLARGKLNRAFRAHGLTTPDPMLVAASTHFDLAELDDPAANGFSHARARHGGAFVAWTEEMPASLARPVVQVLQQALSQLPDGSGAAVAAVTKAYGFLLGQLRDEGDRTGG